MPPDPSFDEVMTRLRAGSEQAAARVFREFAHRLIGLAYQHLDTVLRQKVDPEDVVQSAFKSFFRRNADQPYELNSWDSLWSLLAQITVRKCWHQRRKYRAGGRDVRREAAASSPKLSGAGWEFFDSEPTPSEAAALAETLQRLMQELTPRDRQILALSLQGYAIPEIGAEVRCSERTVYRVLEFIQNRLKALCAAEPR